jgi:hypothetical protein
MRQLAARLVIDIDEYRWPSLVQAATFESMRSRAPTTVPGGGPEQWIDPPRLQPRHERPMARPPRRRRPRPVRDARADPRGRRPRRLGAPRGDRHAGACHKPTVDRTVGLSHTASRKRPTLGPVRLVRCSVAMTGVEREVRTAVLRRAESVARQPDGVRQPGHDVPCHRGPSRLRGRVPALRRRRSRAG